MDEISEDIREKARQAAAAALMRASNGKLVEMLREEISRALLAERQSATAAERERCAMVAESTEDDGWSENFLPSGIAAEQSARIADAIRGGSHDRS